ncbi:carboxymuconolactone decarboxylase family protein [Lactobacillus sp. Marseille-P7033]|nr:carboxymuconolactone decarboxylase family protein [Lactobacillus sp. Marseille-P7033]NGC78379.1 carboxymuconolactone decarboxylase family protein [Limosilactobacillus reuteri]
MVKKQTTGRDQLGDFAPKFAELNDDVLFGQVWSREKELSPRDRSLITVTALITKEEIAEVITQLAFYVGWPNAWSAFNVAKKVWDD